MLSVTSIMLFTIFLYKDIKNHGSHSYYRNYALQFGVACYNVVLLILAMKYLVISIKMKASFEGGDPDKHDTVL